MTNPAAVSVHGVNKMYLLYQKPQDRLKQSLFHRFGKNYARVFWALHDVSFELERGKALGIIGRNGSGKSTLLQVVCGTLQPTNGSVSVNGRVTALLELGAGFNPEFTGRENIFLNGATLDIPNSEMRKRLGEIINFADIGEFIDQPVKIYSSGMYVRLAFAIATSVDPDVLVIDEALAVGDAGFVIKCMNRIRQLRENGATVLLVTHDVQTARSICDEIIWMEEGQIREKGQPLEVTSQYMQYLFGERPAQVLSSLQPRPNRVNLEKGPTHSGVERQLSELANHPGMVRWGNQELCIEGFSIDGGDGVYRTIFEYGQPIHIEFRVRANEDVHSNEIGLTFAFRNTRGLDLITSTTYDEGNHVPPLRKGQVVQVSFDLNAILAPGDYALVLNVEERSQPTPHYFDFIENAAIVKMVSSKLIHSLVLPPVDQKIWLYKE